MSMGKGKGKAESLDRVPVEIQEALILEDLLFVLMGIPGTYITLPPDYSPEDEDPLEGLRFVVSSSLDPSLRDSVERILPLATYYTGICSFIEMKSHLDLGLVNHALCAALRNMLKDYQTLLAQLEHAFNTSPTFTLHKLWFYVHPTLHTLSLLYQLTTELATADDPSGSASSSSSPNTSDAEEEARNEALGLGGAKLKAVLNEIDKNGHEASGIPVKGGEVLAIIWDRIQVMYGDPTANTLYSALLRSAGKPYVEMLQEWMRTGRLVDPYEELCVKESKFIDRGTLEMDYTDEYWERRYTLRDGSTLGSTKQNLAGVPPVRAVGGRLPGGACVPPFLERWKHKILLAGKYLNVIRECGIEISKDSSETNNQEIFLDDEKFYKVIEEAYTHANHTLLRLLLREQQLIPRLRSLKRYFFLSQSSFLTHFLDLSHTELRKPAKGASLVKLQSLLDLALNTDAQGEDALFREDVKVTMAGSSLYEWLDKVLRENGNFNDQDGTDTQSASHTSHRSKKKGEGDEKQLLASDTLQLDYTVNFPLSLVISRKTILRYQLIFRFLLHLKHAERSLSTMWIEHTTLTWRKPLKLPTPRPSLSRPPSRPPSRPGSSAASHPPTPQPPENDWRTDLENWRKRVFLLRARMLACVQQMLAFATFEVLEPNWRKLEGKLEAGKVETVDQLLREHVDFLDTCLKECMLTSRKLITSCSRILRVISAFALYNSALSKDANRALATGESPEWVQQSANRWEILGRFETNFNHWFKVHMDCIQFYASSENVSLLPLVVRLNGIKGPL
ncbi:unnamed protein product [Somion occarium]